MAHVFLPDRPVNEAASEAAVQAGGLPLRAQRRLWEMSAQGHSTFSSTLSAGESLLARGAGIEPISQVMGSSVFHVGFQGYVGWAGGELTALTHAYETARSRALSRMLQEATAMRAHAVVDVRFEGRGFGWGADLIEFNAIGTAVRVEGMPPATPVLTLLRVDEFLKLYHAGYWPVAIVMGNCFWYERHADCFCEGSYCSAELPIHTRASQAARDLAVARFRYQAQHFGAHGVLGVKIRRQGRDEEYESGGQHTSFSVEMLLMGTAVVRRQEARAPARPLLMMDLRDRKANAQFR